MSRGVKETEVVPSFTIKDQTPTSITQGERSRRIIDAIKLMQAVERDYIGKDEITIKLNHNRPIMVLNVADLHMGSIATDYDMIEELRNTILAHDDIYVKLQGDEIEGLKTAYLDTNTARTIPDVHQQIDLVKNIFIQPLAEQGRVFVQTSGHWGHEGWTQDSATVNTWLMMTEEFGIPLLRNGGRLNIQFANGHTQSDVLFHNPPGKSKYDPVYGLRQFLQVISEPERPSMATAAHTHRAGISKDNRPNISKSKSRVRAMTTVNNGAAKGASKNVPPDRFGVKLGFSLADPLGQGYLMMPRTRKSERKLEANYPFLTLDHGLLAFSALQLLNHLESQGMTAEMLEKIQADVEERPVVTFDENRSKRVSNAYDENPDIAVDEDTYKRWDNGGLRPQYDKAVFDIDTRLPIAIDFIQNVRMGSNSEGYKALDEYMRGRFTDNPHALMAFLRNLIDTDTASDPRRKEILDRLIALGARHPNQVLIVMHDGNLRVNSWKKPVGDDYNQGPLPAGTYLAKGMDAQLIRHQSTVELSVGPGTQPKKKPHYSMMTLDKLGRHGSVSRPTFGHSRIYDLYAGEKPGAVVGGHLSHSGFSSRYDRSNSETDTPYFIAPGWWSNTVNTMGKGNAGPGALPGQALILLPGKGKKDYMSFATSNYEETKYLHEALLLWQGLGILGLREKV